MSDARESQQTQTAGSGAATADAAAPPDSADVSPVEDNSHAGQGSVMIDIGGEIGALVVDAPPAMVGVEIEIRPTGNTPYADGSRPGGTHHVHPDEQGPAEPHQHEHPHDPAADPLHQHAHGSADEHPHPHEHPHDPAGVHHGGSVDGHALVHVAVLERPSPSGPRWAAVYPQLHEGTYDLYVRPAEPVALSVTITGGAVTEATWPVRPDRAVRP